MEAKRKKTTNSPVGFYMVDEVVMKMVTAVFQMKLDKLIAEQEIVTKEEEVVNTIQLASSICTQRSYRDLLRVMKTALPKFFGFDALGILLRDAKTQELFTISENNERAPEEEEPGDEFRKATVIRFPSTLGITGHVFNTGEIFMSNKASRESRFSTDIDNLSSPGDVNNFLIGPIFSHKD